MLVLFPSALIKIHADQLENASTPKTPPSYPCWYNTFQVEHHAARRIMDYSAGTA